MGRGIFAARGEERVVLAAAYLQEQVAKVLHVPAAQVGAATAFNDLGMDSIMLMELINAIERDLKLKLLEIYSGRKNAAAFESTAQELYAGTQGQGPLWQQAAEMGRALDPQNTLYQQQAPVDTGALDKTRTASKPPKPQPMTSTRGNVDVMPWHRPQWPPAWPGIEHEAPEPRSGYGAGLCWFVW